MPTGADLAHQPDRIGAELRSGIAFFRADEVDQVMGAAGLLGGAGLGGTDVHVAIDQRRIDADDFHRQLLRQGQRAGGLATGGRAEQQQGGWQPSRGGSRGREGGCRGSGCGGRRIHEPDPGLLRQAAVRTACCVATFLGRAFIVNQNSSLGVLSTAYASGCPSWLGIMRQGGSVFLHWPRMKKRSSSARLS